MTGLTERQTLTCIHRSILAVEAYLRDGPEPLLEPGVVRDAVARRLEIIGEAVHRGLSRSLRDRHPDVDWHGWYRLRNRLAHDHHRIDYAKVAETIAEDLPGLHRAVHDELERGCRPAVPRVTRRRARRRRHTSERAWA